jgi:pyrroloquinoline quinone biosynthesis protein B
MSVPFHFSRPAMKTQLLIPLAMVLAVACAPSSIGPSGAKLQPSVTKVTMSDITGPRVRLLGIAQDGGLPHAACNCTRCTAARKDPALASFVTSLGIIAPKAKTTYLIDATPDIIPQLALLADTRTVAKGAVDRTPVDGIFLTHAHVGHYLGLAHLGFEAVNTKELPVWCSQRMGAFLTGNAPWDQLVRLRNLSLNHVTPGKAVTLPDGIEVTPILVPHRDEYTDTLAFILKGKRKRILYIPDTAPWHRWKTSVDAVFDQVDVALVDGTFYSGAELPGRDLSKIGHPLIVDSITLLKSRVDSGKLQVHFIHLNHSNPALEPHSKARKHIESQGFHVGRSGLEVAL